MRARALEGVPTKRYAKRELTEKPRHHIETRISESPEKGPTYSSTVS